MTTDIHELFFKLLRTGLWGSGDRNLQIAGTTDWEKTYSLAVDQSVQGLVLQGLEWHKGHNPKSIANLPLELLLQWIGEVQIIEQQNKAMNEFVAKLIEILRNNGIYALLVKGQGIAQCYERPLWRSAGDVDFFLSRDNYEKAVRFLSPLASNIDEENSYNKHLAMTIGQWVVELHGSLRSDLWKNIDKSLDELQNCIIYGGNVRSWINGETQIFIPAVNEDIVFVFSHILQHFFRGGIGLRQVCDWCRLMWTYRDTIDNNLLEKRLHAMGILSEWNAFASLAVDWLGMPKDTVPFYSSSKKWSNKADRIIAFILETGNFGHSRDKSYYREHNYLVYKAISLWRNTWDSMRHFMIFPLDATKVWFRMIGVGVTAVANRK